MALDSKTIKEEILDKDIYEVNTIRAKGELFIIFMDASKKKKIWHRLKLSVI